MSVFSGGANRALAEKIAGAIGLALGRATVGRFSDGEVQVEIHDNVRGRDVFIVQPTCAPTNDHLVELLIMIDALHRASAGRITAVIPYFGYGRQDRRAHYMRVPISAKVIANVISSVQANRVLIVDLHSDQVQGFFDLPVDNVYASPVLLEDIRARNHDDMIIVSPDVGGVVRARALAKRLDDAGLAIIDKRRPRPNQSEVMNIIGDVAGKSCVIIDDIVDTAGTLCEAAAALKGRARARCWPTRPTRCFRAAPSRASPPRRSTNWSSPTRFRCRRTRPNVRAFARSAFPRCWRRRYSTSTASNPSAACSWTCSAAAFADAAA